MHNHLNLEGSFKLPLTCVKKLSKELLIICSIICSVWGKKLLITSKWLQRVNKEDTEADSISGKSWCPQGNNSLATELWLESLCKKHSKYSCLVTTEFNKKWCICCVTVRIPSTVNQSERKSTHNITQKNVLLSYVILKKVKYKRENITTSIVLVWKLKLSFQMINTKSINFLCINFMVCKGLHPNFYFYFPN